MRKIVFTFLTIMLCSASSFAQDADKAKEIYGQGDTESCVQQNQGERVAGKALDEEKVVEDSDGTISTKN